MAEIIHLATGSRPPKQPNTAIIRVITRGGGSFARDETRNRFEWKMHPSDVQSTIDKLTNAENIQTVYVVGFDDKAKEQARQFDQLRERVSQALKK
jgi:hypothetical protein